MNTKTLNTIVILVGAYLAAQIFADITSLRIVMIAGFSVDAGTLVYPFTFTLRDLVHKVAGVAVARTLIFLAAALNIAMALLFWVTAQLPADPAVGAQLEFATVLAPVWRIVFASIAAEVVSELLDTEAYRLWERRFGNRWQWGRVLISNAVSVPVDSAVFVVGAFAGVLHADVVVAVFAANVLIKGAVTLLSLPGIYIVKTREHAA